MENLVNKDVNTNFFKTANINSKTQFSSIDILPFEESQIKADSENNISKLDKLVNVDNYSQLVEN